MIKYQQSRGLTFLCRNSILIWTQRIADGRGKAWTSHARWKMSIIKLVLCVEYWFHFVLLSTGKHAHSLYLHLTIIAVADHNAMYGWLNLDKKTGPVSRHDKIITSVSQSILYFWFYVNFVLLLCNSKDFILRSGSGRPARESELANLQILCKPVWPD